MTVARMYDFNGTRSGDDMQKLEHNMYFARGVGGGGSIHSQSHEHPEAAKCWKQRTVRDNAVDCINVNYCT